MSEIGLRPYAVSTILVLMLVAGTSLSGAAQEVVDRSVAVVRDSARSELITQSDVLWQLALKPGVPLDPPRPEDLDAALQTLIDQRLFALEAARLPRLAPDEKEIRQKIAELVSHFPSPAAFEARLQRVGFRSVKDEAFERLIGRRLSIDKYVDFRFRSFVVVTADEEQRYYNDVWAPEFRRKSPGQLLPSLDEQRRTIHELAVEQKVAAAIERFLEEARLRTEVERLVDVKSP